jgi:hypothetical protein
MWKHHVEVVGHIGGEVTAIHGVALPIIKRKGKVVMELNLDHKLECKSFLPVFSAASLNCHYN